MKTKNVIEAINIFTREHHPELAQEIARVTSTNDLANLKFIRLLEIAYRAGECAKHPTQ